MSNHSRRAVLAGIASAPALAAPALALPIADPIFAAIERHRAAAEAHTSMIDEQAELELSIPHNRRRTHHHEVEDAAPGDDPRWIDHLRRANATSDQLEEARQQLFDAPMSLAGLAALIDYMDEVREQGNGDWDDAWSLPTTDEMLSELIHTVRRVAVS